MPRKGSSVGEESGWKTGEGKPASVKQRAKKKPRKRTTKKTAKKKPRKTPRGPAVSLEKIEVSRCVTLRRNPQYLTPHQLDALKASISRDGFLAPILVRPARPADWDEKKQGKYSFTKRGYFEVLSGNHRFMAGQESGMEVVPALVKPMNDRDARRVAVNLNTIHGDPNAELLAPYLAELEDDLLQTVHLPDALLKDLKDFDAQLKERLDALQPHDAVNQDSQVRIPDCACPTCGRLHIRKEAQDGV